MIIILEVKDENEVWRAIPYICPKADQKYNPESTNAQSGLATAEAVVDKVAIFKGEKITKDLPADDNYDIVMTVGKDELLNAKAGDLYINESENVICRIISVEIDEENDYRTITFRREEWNEAIVELKADLTELNNTIGDINAILSTVVDGGAE